MRKNIDFHNHRRASLIIESSVRIGWTLIRIINHVPVEWWPLAVMLSHLYAVVAATGWMARLNETLVKYFLWDNSYSRKKFSAPYTFNYRYSICVLCFILPPTNLVKRFINSFVVNYNVIHKAHSKYRLKNYKTVTP